MFAPLRQLDFFPTSDSSPTSSSDPRRARTSAAPIRRGKASMENAAASSSRLSASSESAALVGSLLRTALISELEALTGSSPRWRASATPAGHSWSVLTMSAPTTSGNGHGSSDATSTKLPTPVAGNSGSNQGGGMERTGPIRHDTKTMIRQSLSTPRASDMKAGGHGDTGRMGTVRHQLHAAGMLGTPTSNPAPRGSVLRREKGRETSAEDQWDRVPNAGEIVHFMLPTCRASDASHGPEIAKATQPGATGVSLVTTLAMGERETLPTPTKRDKRDKRDKRMDAWSPAYDKRKSPMDAVMDGAMTDRAGDKWAYARQIAAVLTEHGLSGASQTLPVVYGWMMGYPPGWLERALLSAVREGLLPPPSSSKPMGTPCSRKSRKPSGGQS